MKSIVVKSRSNPTLEYTLKNISDHSTIGFFDDIVLDKNLRHISINANMDKKQ